METTLDPTATSRSAEQEPSDGGSDAAERRARELGMWLCAAQSFFRLHNHPLTEDERAGVLSRDFGPETRVAQAALLRCAQLALALQVAPSATGADDVGAFDERAEPLAADGTRGSYVALHDALRKAWASTQSLLRERPVSFAEWAECGKALSGDLQSLGSARRLMSAARQRRVGLQPELVALAEGLTPDALGASLLAVFSRLALLLERLRHVEQLLWRDQPLKQTLPLFALLHEETRDLLELIEKRALHAEGAGQSFYEALDGTAYAVRMELRKTFEHELSGLGALRPATYVYAKVEAAHGLLRDCFQQSTVTLAQVFAPSLEGVRLFDAFQTKLDQSLALRRDLWLLLERVRRAEQVRERRLNAQLLTDLSAFRDGSMRFLMYKDWEAFERFTEEVAAARGAGELGPVLHRFSAYLETLFGQVNMRAVLANHPFDFPTPDA